MAHKIIVHENGKQYAVWARARYAYIRTEKQLRQIVDHSIAVQYGDKATEKPFFDKCSLLGILCQSRPVER